MNLGMGADVSPAAKCDSARRAASEFKRGFWITLQCFAADGFDCGIFKSRMKQRKKSQELHARASRVIPGGVDSPVRAFKSVGGEPPYIVRGNGPRIWDADGNEYVDYVGSWGPLIL